MASKVAEIVTDQIIKFIEDGQTLPWQKPWRVDLQRNLNSKRPYRGINTLLLEMYSGANGYESNFWCTYNGAKKAGGSVKKGEKSHIVVFYKMIPKKMEDGDIDEEVTIPILRYYRVFNLDQCEGIEIPKQDDLDFVPDERAESVIANMPNPPSIKHGGNKAYYRPPTDSIQLPKREKFNTVDAYYLTAFHELVHSTGHENRLNRQEVMKTIVFGDTDYSKEELVAEIGAAMLGSYCNFDPSNLENSASYVESWLKKLKDDKGMIVSAASRAQKAYDYILGTEPEPVNNED